MPQSKLLLREMEELLIVKVRETETDVLDRCKNEREIALSNLTADFEVTKREAVQKAETPATPAAVSAASATPCRARVKSRTWTKAPPTGKAGAW